MLASLKKELFLFMLCISLFSVHAELFSVDPCEGQITITQDADNYYLDSACYNIRFPKLYNNTINFYDKYNDDFFDLKLYSLQDLNNANPNQKKTMSFEDNDFTASVDGNTINYINPAGDIKLSYSVDKNKVKAGIEITGWASNYALGRLVLRTRIHKENIASSHFINQPAVVDGITQPLIIDEIQAGVNRFYEQQLIVANSFSYLFIDPLYQVDYSPEPAQQLQDGVVYYEPDSAFDNIVNITAGVSDNNTATKYLSAIGTQTYDTTLDYTDGGYENTVSLNTNSEILAVDFDIDTLIINQSTINVCARASRSDTGVIAKLTVGTTFYDAISLPTGASPGNFTCQSLNVSLLSNGTNRIGIGCDSGCGGSKRLYLSTDTSAPDNTSFYYAGSWTNITTDDYGIKIVVDSYNESTGYALVGKWTETYDPTYDWYLRIYKTAAGTANLNVFAYNDTDNIAVNTSDSLAGIGWFNINVNSLMGYMYNQSLNYSKLRFYSVEPNYFSEIQLRKEVNDTTAPTINNCTMNDSYVINGEYVRIQCNITDNVDVDFANTTIHSTEYSMVKNDDIYYADIVCCITNNGTNNWQIVEAYDLSGNNNSYYPGLSFLCNITVPTILNLTATTSDDAANITFQTDYAVHNVILNYGTTMALGTKLINNSISQNWRFELTNLTQNTTYYYNITFNCSLNYTYDHGYYNFTTNISCNWVPVYGSCLTNDSRFIYYTETYGCGTLKGLPADNGTYIYCNYCSEDLEQLFGACIIYNSTWQQNYTWRDNNLFSCCIITMLPSDCSILSLPYNETGWQNCTGTYTDFELSLDSELNFGFDIGGLKSDKVYGKIFINDTNHTYKCLSYVKRTTGELLQVNPPYTKRTDSVLQLFGKEIEDREYFQTYNGLANIYWTDHNVILDGRQYIWGVECAAPHNSTVLRSEQLATAVHKNLDRPTTLYYWTTSNLSSILMILIVIFFIATLTALVLKWLKRG